MLTVNDFQYGLQPVFMRAQATIALCCILLQGIVPNWWPNKPLYLYLWICDWKKNVELNLHTFFSPLFSRLILQRVLTRKRRKKEGEEEEEEGGTGGECGGRKEKGEEKKEGSLKNRDCFKKNKVLQRPQIPAWPEARSTKERDLRHFRHNLKKKLSESHCLYYYIL